MNAAKKKTPNKKQAKTAASRKGKTIGYIRVSTFDQNPVRQLDGVPCDKTFTDKASGKDTHRPQLQAALEYVRDGDTLVVHSLDRLGRNLADLLKIVSDLVDRDVTVRFVKENLTFTDHKNAQSTLFLSLMGAFAEFERSLIRERQREGIELAKQAGVYKGRKPALSETRRRELRRRVRIESHGNKAALAREFGISRQTLYNCLNA